MACFFPWKAYRHLAYKPGGDVPFLTTNPGNALNKDAPLTLPCGSCNGCISDRKRMWAVRCMHEAKMHKLEGGNAFITLTYRPEDLPSDLSVSLRRYQLFMKRLRTEMSRKGLPKVRFFACGEYGDEGLRPHYHALIFGYDFRDDRYKWRTSKFGPVYRSPFLERVWGKGNCEIGTVTIASARYVAGYVTKKIQNRGKASAYDRVNLDTGELHTVLPEFATMSTNPGIGATWLQKYAGDAFPSDFVIFEGRKYPVPSYYLRKQAEGLQTSVKRSRKAQALKNKANSTPERLMVRSEILDRKLKLSRRTL